MDDRLTAPRDEGIMITVSSNYFDESSCAPFPFRGVRFDEKGGIMRQALICLVPLCLIAFLSFGCGDIESPAQNEEMFALSAARAADGEPPLCAHAVDLIAGRTLDIGAVRCWIRGDYLHVLCSAEGGWALGETQLDVVASFDDFPLTKKGNPKIGHFPFKKTSDPPAAEIEYAIDLDALGLKDAATLFVALHAEAALPSGTGGIEREEGAWAEGERFIGGAPGIAAGDDRLERPAETKGGNIAILEEDPEPAGNWAMFFEVDANDITVNELVINEIFFAGSCASSFYFYDQFVELYNPSADTLYLDNIIVTRQSQTVDPDMETKDYVMAIYAFQLQGTGKQYPIVPGQHVVIAADAVNHHVYCVDSPDLSGADYEFFNPIGNDYDTPGVPNFVNIMPGRTADFLLNLSHNAVVIAKGGNYPIDENSYMHIPVGRVIDGVEYASNSAIAAKEMTVRVDAGFAGNGVVKYGGQSTERRIAGLDTDDSTNDFTVTPHPTPGWQH
jgi:hypothetical protein